LKLIIKDADQEACAWFEPGERCDLRVSLTSGLSITAIRHALIALGWTAVHGEQTHFDTEPTPASHLFSRKWNKVNQVRARTAAFEAIQASVVSQLLARETLDKVEPKTFKRRVSASAPIETLPGL
jgi:hypothetical protein